MYEIKKIHNVTNYCFVKDNLIIVGNEKFDGNEGIISNAPFGKRPVVCFDNYILIQYKQFGEIEVFDLDGDIVKRIEEGFNLYSIYKERTNIILVNKLTKTYWCINENLSINNLNYYKQYHFQIFEKLYSIENIANEQYISQYNFFSQEPNWSIILEQKLYISSGTSPMGDKDKLYIPFEKTLVCFNIKTGKKLWSHQSSTNCTYDIGEHFIYKNDGTSVSEINKETGQYQRIIRYSEISYITKFSSSGPIWVFEKEICLVNVLSGEICIIEKETMKLKYFFNLEAKIPNDKKSINIVGKELFLLDGKDTMYIIGFDS